MSFVCLQPCTCLFILLWPVATNLLCTCCLLCTPLLLLLSSTPLYSSPLLSSCCFFATSTTSLLLLSTTSDCPICLSGSEDIKHMMFLHCHVAFSGKQHLLFFCQISPLLYLLPPFLSSMFWKQHLLFFAKSPLSSICCHLSYPLCYESSTCFFAKSPLSFVLPMMKLSKSIHYMEYELMSKNL